MSGLTSTTRFCGGRAELVHEVCDGSPFVHDALEKLHLDALPEADDCLRRRLCAESSSKERFSQIYMQRTSELIWRVAAAAIYDELLVFYRVP